MAIDMIIVEIDPAKLPTHKQLWEEAEAANTECTIVLINMWRKYKDPEIEALFKSLGGIYIDGAYMFGGK